MTPSDTSSTSPQQPPPQPERRRLILDEDITHKLARELENRGKTAGAVLHQRIDGRKDGALFKALRDLEPYVLVTWDNKMPFVHTHELEHHGTTLAVVNRAAFYKVQHEYANEVVFIREVVHRWAHVIQIQTPNTVRSYSDRSASRAKTPIVYARTTRPPR
ncbi:MAG TPA: hypothetical protein VGM91_15900 [Conexibacter sp.]|jgi:hypothetical protein